MVAAVGGWAENIPLDPAKVEVLNAKVEQVRFNGKKALRATVSEEALKQAAARAAAAKSGKAGAKKGGKKGGGGGPAAAEAGRVEVLVFPRTASFSNGTIELDIAGDLSPAAGEAARGFVGVAFRVKEDKRTYDAFYLRPTNGRADDQERRNHTVQYIAHPEWPWFRLRQETPGKYESYADIGPGEWVRVKIDVDGDKARVYVNGAKQPTLLVNDVKSGANGSGTIALWLESSTIGHFANLKVTRR
jgi:hypothetical protein